MNNVCKGRIIAWIIVVMMMGGLVCCSQGPAATKSFDALAAQWQHDFEAPPQLPECTEIINSLVEAARAEGQISEQDNARDLMVKHADDAVGLYIFKSESERLAESPNLECEFYDYVKKRAQHSKIGLAATHHHLLWLQQNDQARFLEQCASILGNVDSKEAKLALLVRGEFYCKSGKFKQGALDYLKFWACFPETVNELEKETQFLSALRHAGYFMEASILEHVADVESNARRLSQLLESLPGEESDATTAPSSLLEAYVRYTPDVKRVRSESSALEARSSLTERALLSARLASMNLRELDVEAANSDCIEFAGHVRQALKCPEGQDLEWLHVFSEGLVHSLVTMYGPGGFLDESELQTLAQSRHNQDIVLSLADLNLQMAQALSQSPTEVCSAVMQYVELCKQFHERQRVVAALKGFIASFSGTEVADKMALELGNYYREEMNLPGKAREVFQDLATRGREGAFGEIALLKQALSEYDIGFHSECYQTSQLLLTKYPESRQAPNALLLGALAQAAMGMTDDAREDMHSLCDRYPQSKAGSDALLWLARSSLKANDYDEAQKYYTQLLERFPDSGNAHTARNDLASISRGGETEK